MAMNWVKGQLTWDGRATCAMGHDHRNPREALECGKKTGAKTSFLKYENTKTGEKYEGLIDRYQEKEYVETKMDPFTAPVTAGFTKKVLAVSHTRNKIALADTMKQNGIKGIDLENTNAFSNDPFDVQFPDLEGATPGQMFQYLEKAKDLEKKTQAFIEKIRHKIN